MAGKDLKEWRESEGVIGRWQKLKRPLRIKKGSRSYEIDWLAKDLGGTRLPLTHSGRYLKVKVGGKWEYFHRQLLQDHKGEAVDGSIWHIHHKDRRKKEGSTAHQVHRPTKGEGWNKKNHQDDQPKNNRLANLQKVKKKEHLKMHAVDGGKAKAGRKHSRVRKKPAKK